MSDHYDYRLRCLVQFPDEGDSAPISAHRNRKGDYFGWYEGEVVTLQVRHSEGTLNIKLDKRGNVSFQRTTRDGGPPR